MSKVPEYLKGFNGIVRLIENTCEDPWTLYVECAFEPLGDAFLTLLTFGMDDIMRGFFRPTKALRSSRHGRRGRKGGRGKGIPEIGDTIGSKVEKKTTGGFFSERPVTQGVRMLWVVDGVVQRGLWWWLIFDVLNDFFFDWATAIMESHEDDDCEPARVLAHGDSDVTHALFGWNSPWAPEIKYQHDLGWDVIFTDLPANKRFHVSFGCDCELNPGTGSNVEAGLFTDGTFTTAIQTGGEVFIPGGGSGQVLVSADVEGPQRVVIAIRNTFGLVFLSNIWVFIKQVA